jgi:hypothetical protein
MSPQQMLRRTPAHKAAGFFHVVLYSSNTRGEPPKIMNGTIAGRFALNP